MSESNWQKLEAILGVKFNDLNLLKQALTHRSYLNENKTADIAHNERLEFLGDAVLELLVSDHLYKQYSEANEGALTVYRSALVNTVELGLTAEALGVNDYLLLSKGEARDTGRARQVILADTYESIIGAIYLDQGYATAESFVRRTLFPRLVEIIKDASWQDAKSFFQEKAQEVAGTTPRYEVMSQTGPDHNKTFVIGVYLNNELVAEGAGPSKQEAEQEAARSGLKARGWKR